MICQELYKRQNIFPWDSNLKNHITFILLWVFGEHFSLTRIYVLWYPSEHGKFYEYTRQANCERAGEQGLLLPSAVLDLSLVRHWQKQDKGKVKGPWKEDGKGQKTDVH